MSDLRLRLVCGPYDRMEAIRTGEVKPKGIDLEMVPVKSPREIFDRVMAGEDFDVAEMSTSEFIANTSRGSSPHVAIPVFPSRLFRHGFIAVNSRAGIATPKDLEGRRIGVQLYTMTAAVWIRGMLEDEFGVDLSGVTWVQGAVQHAGTHGSPKAPPLLKPIKLEFAPPAKSLDDLLKAGEIDAYMGAQLPPSLGRDPAVQRLFPDYRAREKDYYLRTGIHPIMHSIVIKKDVYSANPWVAQSLFDAFADAKARAWADLNYTGASKVMLAWLHDEVAEANEVFGNDPFAYGLAKNRHTIETLVKYLHRHNMISNQPTADQLFVDVGA
ncbi:MAG: ABC transporter substrate-binding protein [Hyphomicrobiaceae bacterium]